MINWSQFGRVSIRIMVCLTLYLWAPLLSGEHVEIVRDACVAGMTFSLLAWIHKLGGEKRGQKRDGE